MDKKHPIGAQILTKTMMDCSFHHTDDVLKVIEDFRETAASVRYDFRDKLLKAPDEALMDSRGFNNAVSILGSRGTGKTSVIMTLQHILKVGKENWINEAVPDKPKPNNIMLPILIPQDYSPKQTLLSWLIIQLIQKAEQIERELASEGKASLKRKVFEQWIEDKGEHYKCDPLRECMDALKLSFELRYKNGLKRSGEDSDQVYHYMDEVRRDSGLVLDLLKLVTMMADYYRYRINGDACQSKPENEPLFFFVIDDLDLAPERSQEVLLLMLRYLQHPNIVVLCGWYEQLFQTHLCIEILKSQGALEPELLDTNFGYDDVFMKRRRQRVAALDSARRLAMDNLKKAFPPAQRFEIRSLTTQQRAEFPVFGDQPEDADKKREKDFFEYIEETLKAFRPSVSVDFLYNYHHEYLQIYMRIFDSKARGMTNAVKAFREFRENAIRWDRQKELDITSSLQALLDAMIFSNTRFAPYRCGIRDLITIKKVVLDLRKKDNKSEYNCYFDFNRVRPIFNDYKAHDEYAKQHRFTGYKYMVEREFNYFPSLTLDIYILLNFMQNLTRYLAGIPIYEHGGYEFSDALNEIIPGIDVEANSGNPLSDALLVANLDSIQLFPNTDDFRINLNLLDTYENNDISDLHHSFAGADSYRRLSQALFSVASPCNTRKRSFMKSNALMFPKQPFDYLLDRVPDWFQKMLRLFEALHFDEGNVKRLTMYRSIKAQKTYQFSSQVVEVVNKPMKDQAKAWKEENPLPMQPLFPDQVLDKIIACLRATSQFQNSFNEAGRINRNSKSNAMKYNREYWRAINYIGVSMTNNRTDSIRDFDYSEYYNKLVAARNVSDDEAKQAARDEETLKEAVKCVERDKDVLLSKLRDGLESAMYAGYNMRQSSKERFAYLLHASDAIARYIEKWNLGYGGWTNREADAVDALMEVYQRYGLVLLYNLTQELASLGPNLERTGRNQYSEIVLVIKRWMQDKTKEFSDEDREIAKKNLDILENALTNIRRLDPAESLIHGVLLELGFAIAQKCADLSYEEEILKDKTSSERHMTSWPIVEKSRDEFDRWQNEFGIRQYIHRDAPDTNVSSTFFDMNL